MSASETEPVPYKGVIVAESILSAGEALANAKQIIEKYRFSCPDHQIYASYSHHRPFTASTVKATVNWYDTDFRRFQQLCDDLKTHGFSLEEGTKAGEIIKAGEPAYSKGLYVHSGELAEAAPVCKSIQQASAEMLIAELRSRGFSI